MSSETRHSLTAITAYLSKRIAANDFPSAVYLMAEKGKAIFTDALGRAVVEPRDIAAQMETIYDLASATKPLVTGLLFALLIQRFEIALDNKVSSFFTEFDSADKRHITIGQLLTHTSGIKAWTPFYLRLRGASENLSQKALRLIANDPLEVGPGEKVIYSDVNFVVLGILLEKLFGKTLDEIARSEIIEPLGLVKTFFNPPPVFREQIAASETGNEFEKQMCAERGFAIDEAAFRRDLIWGEVHDGNCWFFGGVAGHAGLFSNAGETFEIAKQFLPATSNLLTAETCGLFRTNFTAGMNEARSLGFELAATENSTAGATLNPDSFGHLGFTGTSLWIDPAFERIYILLTNRTHNRKLPFANINSVRRKFHELARAVLTEES
jgi:CubicO group peptidase (beta-lactamase class C family)